jgi:Icc-related predicted phosphoesterase
MLRVLHISDWHADADSFKKILSREIREDPRMLDSDLIVLTGDMVFNSYACFSQPSLEGAYQRPAFQEMLDFLDVCFPGVDVIGVRGNHDYFNYGIQGDSWEGIDIFEIYGYKCASLRGVPLHMGSWNDELVESELDALAQRVPLDTQILITHAPPFGILDDVRDLPPEHHNTVLWNIDRPMPTIIPRNIGSQAFRLLVDRLPDLQLHMFGHVHEQGDRVEVRNNVIFSNASTTANYIVLPLAS